MSGITAVESVGEQLYGAEREDNLSGALEQMAAYVRDPGKVGWYQLSGVYFVVRALFSTEKEKDWAFSYEHLEQDMMALSQKFSPISRGDLQMIAEDLEALARENPRLNHTEVKRGLVSCLKGILDQRPTGGVFNNAFLLSLVTTQGQLVAISCILSEGDFSPALRSKGESLRSEVEHFYQFGAAARLGLSDSIYRIIDLLEREL